MRRKLMMVALGSVCFAQFGCATLFSNSNETIIIRGSTDEAAEVRVEAPTSTYKSKLPVTYTGKPSGAKSVTVVLTDECYEPTSVTVDTSINTTAWLNLLNGWGFLVDWITGAIWDYEGNTLMQLQKKEGVEGCDSENAKNLGFNDENLISQL
jgi:hypothetical protein